MLLVSAEVAEQIQFCQNVFPEWIADVEYYAFGIVDVFPVPAPLL